MKHLFVEYLRSIGRYEVARLILGGLAYIAVTVLAEVFHVADGYWWASIVLVGIAVGLLPDPT